jgi:hypothetical protein
MLHISKELGLRALATFDNGWNSELVSNIEKVLIN